MHHVRLRALLVAALSLGLTAALGSQSAVAASSTSSQVVNSILAPQAASLAASSGVTTAQVDADLNTQTQAGAVNGAVLKALGPDYAGVWWDDATDVLHVNVLNATDRQAASAVIAPTGVSDHTQYDTVPYSWSQLVEEQNALTSVTSALASTQESAVGLSARTDSVWITLSDATPANDASQVRMAAELAPVPVEVKTVPASTLAISADSCSFPYCDVLQGGTQVASSDDPDYGYAICTAGFVVVDPNNAPYLLTAGHCFDGGSGVWYDDVWGSANSSGSGCNVGDRAWSDVSSSYDAGLIAISQSAGQCGASGNYTGEIAAWGNSPISYEISSTEIAPEGEYECMYGRTSEDSCGYIETGEVDVTTEIDYSGEGLGTIDLEHTDWICGTLRPGDSGGPWAFGPATPGPGTGTDISIAGNSESCADGGVAVGDELTGTGTGPGEYTAIMDTPGLNLSLASY